MDLGKNRPQVTSHAHSNCLSITSGIQEDRALPDPLMELTSSRSHSACVSPKLCVGGEANEKPLQKIGFFLCAKGGYHLA